MTAVTEESSKSTVPFSTETVPGDRQINREKEAIERSLIDASTRGPVLALFGTAGLWLLVASVLTLISSIQLHSPDLFEHIPWIRSWLTYGRVYPAAQNAFIYGWCSLAGMGVSIWVLARLCRVSLPYPGILTFGALFWNVGLAAGIVSILAGAGRPIEGMELPSGSVWLMFIGFVFIGLWGAVLYRYRRQAVAFISVWYLLGAFFWFPWLIASANVLTGLQGSHGVMQNVISAWYAQNVVYWWLVPIGIGSAYFFIPKVINKPVYSYNLATLGFWTYALLSGLTGMTKLTGGPIPVWLSTLSISATIMMIVPIATVAVNLVVTMRGQGEKMFYSPTVRFTYFGTLAFAFAGALFVLSSLRSVDRIVHFTQFTNGCEMILLYSFFSMVMFGAIYYITPRLVGCEWLSSRMISYHFWGAAYGGSMAAAMLIFSGLAQGVSYADPKMTSTQVLAIAEFYFPGRTIALFIVTFAHVIFVAHFFLMLARIGQPGGEPTLFAPLDEEKH